MSDQLNVRRRRVPLSDFGRVWEEESDVLCANDVAGLLLMEGFWQEVGTLECRRREHDDLRSRLSSL